MCSKHHLLSIGHHTIGNTYFLYYKNILWCNAFNAPLTSCRFYERILLWKRKEENCIKMKVIGNFISLLLAFNLLIVIKAFEKIDGQALNDIFYFHFGKNNNGILFPKLFWPSVRKKNVQLIEKKSGLFKKNVAFSEYMNIQQNVRDV